MQTDPSTPVYFSVQIPYSHPHRWNAWTPDSPVGPFSVLTRGAFKTSEEADAWAAERLEGAPYEVVTFPEVGQ